MKHARRLAGAACALALWLPIAWAQPAAETRPRPPVEAFARLPMLTDVVLSPDGRQFAALHQDGDRSALITRPLAGGKAKVVLDSDNQRFHFGWVRWFDDQRLLVGLRFAARRGFVGTVETRLISIKADGSGLVNLVHNDPLSGSMFGGAQTQQLQDQVIDWLPGDGRHVLLQLAESSGAAGVYKVDVESGTRRLVQVPLAKVRAWITDAQHRVRVALREDEGEFQIRARGPEEGAEWRTLWTFRRDGDAVWPLGFGLDPQRLYVIADHEGRDAVFVVQLDQPGLPRELRLADPRLDVGGELLHSPASGEVLGLRGNPRSGDGSPRSELWDPAWRALAQAIDRGLPERFNRLQGISRDEQRYLIYSSGNRRPGQYYVGDRRGHEVSLLGETYPELDPAALAGKHALRISARDGLPLNAYLTLPAGRRPADPGPALPLVLLPHGGPQSRDDADFDAWTEFLASRGYAVLQVNFRGSAGYGRAFRLAGLQRWGLEMQDDLSDAVQWAVTANVADAKRVCIVGASYGGYAALMGLVKTPELYRCGISFAGVSDLPDLVRHQSDYIGGEAAAEAMIGRAWGDRERLRATSPALQAERIQAPVLLVHGSADRVVPVEQSEAMAKALRRAGKTHRYIEQEDGDHQLSRYTHRLQFFQAMEAFLDEHVAAGR